jgi:hypothetical protein
MSTRLRRPPTARFLATNVAVWLLMVVVLVLVPDWLERRLGLALARVVGWAVAGGFWFVSVERAWQQRYGPFTRFALQTVLWVAAVLLASFISEQARIW